MNESTRAAFDAGRIILGYNTNIDPIPPFDPAGPRCWMGPGSLSCDGSIKVGFRMEEPRDLTLFRCIVTHDRRIDRCDESPEPPPTPVQSSLFGAP